MPTYAELTQAVLKADAAGDIAGAQVLADMAKQMRAPPAPIVPPKPATGRTWGEAFTDPLAGVVKGVGQAAQLPGQLYGLATGDFDTAAMRGPETLQKFGESLQSQGLKVRQALADKAISEAGKEGIASEFMAAIWQTLKDPALVSSFIAEQVPQLLPSLITGGGYRLLSGGAGQAAKYATEEAAKEAAKASAKTATKIAVGTGAVQQGADVGVDTYEAALKLTEKQYPNMSEQERKDIAIAKARVAAIEGGALSLAAQRLPGAKAIEKRIAGVPGQGRIRGALGEAASEITEEAGGKFASNIGLQEIDPAYALSTGVGQAAGMGALGGTLMGGALGARPPVPPDAPVAPPATPPVAVAPPVAPVTPDAPSVAPAAPITLTPEQNAKVAELTAQYIAHGYDEVIAPAVALSVVTKEAQAAAPPEAPAAPAPLEAPTATAAQMGITPEVMAMLTAKTGLTSDQIVQAATLTGKYVSEGMDPQQASAKAHEDVKANVKQPNQPTGGTSAGVASVPDTGVTAPGTQPTGVVPTEPNVGEPAAREGQQPVAVEATEGLSTPEVTAKRNGMTASKTGYATNFTFDQPVKVGDLNVEAVAILENRTRFVANSPKSGEIKIVVDDGFLEVDATATGKFARIAKKDGPNPASKDERLIRQALGNGVVDTFFSSPDKDVQPNVSKAITGRDLSPDSKTISQEFDQKYGTQTSEAQQAEPQTQAAESAAPSFEQDYIPSEEWLKDKQEEAERAISTGRKDTYGKGVMTSQTARFNLVNLPVSDLYTLPGANQEQQRREDTTTGKNIRLEAEIGIPSNFDTKKHPIHVLVNHKGEAYISEGNHRLAYAKRHGIKNVFAKIDYVAGGERANGPMSPDKVKSLANDKLAAAEGAEEVTPDHAESQRMDDALRGKTFDEALAFALANASDAGQKAILQKAGRRIQELKAKGFEFAFRLAGKGQELTNNALGLVQRDYSGLGQATRIEMILNGATGRSNTLRQDILAHELVHTATAAMIDFAPLSSVAQQLRNLQQEVVEEFNRRAKAGTLNAWEKRIHEGRNNALKDAHELLAWGLTDKNMQNWLASMEDKSGKSWLSKLYDIVANVLNLNGKEKSVLARLMSISEDIFVESLEEYQAQANREGKSFGKQANATGYPSWALKYEGDVVWAKGNIALYKATARNGNTIYIAGKENVGQTRVDIRSFTGNTFTPTELTTLKQAADKLQSTSPSQERAANQTDTPAFREWFGDSKMVDKDGKPLVVYRGGAGGDLTESFLNAEAREGYATFASDNPAIANTYANPDLEFDEAGAVTPLYVKATRLIEFPVTTDKNGRRSFDKFAFDRRALTLAPGEVLVVRQVLDTGPRAKLAVDPGRLWSYPSDIYAWGPGTSVKSATGNRGTFSKASTRISEATSAPPAAPAAPTTPPIDARSQAEVDREVKTALEKNKLSRTATETAENTNLLYALREGKNVKNILVSNADAISNTSLGALLGTLPGDVVASMGSKALGNENLNTTNSLIGSMRGMSHQLLKAAGGVHENLVRAIGKEPSLRAKLENVIYVSTTSRVDPSVDTRSAVLNKMYNDLGPNGQRLYKEMKQYYESMVNYYSFLLDEQISSANLPPGAHTFIMAEIKKIYEADKRINPYFPLVRHGDLWLRVGEKGKKQFYTFATNAERDAVMREIAKSKGTTVGDMLQDKKQMDRGDDLTSFRIEASETSEMLKAAFSRIDSIKNTGKQTQADFDQSMSDLKDSMYELYLTSMPEQSFRKSFIERKDITGYSTDVVRNFSTSATHMASQLSRIAFGGKIRDSLTAAQASLEGNPNKVRYERYVQEMQRRASVELHPFADPPAGVSRGVQKAGQAAGSFFTRLSFIHYLSSASSALIQFTSIPYGMANLGARHGYAATSKEFARMMRLNKEFGIRRNNSDGSVSLVSPSIAESANLTADEKRAMKEMGARGVDITLTNEILGRGRMSSLAFEGKAETIKRGVMTAVGGLFHNTERISREFIYMMSYRLARKASRAQVENGTITNDQAHKQAVDQAVVDTYDSAGNMSEWNRAPIFRGVTGRIALQFLSYPLFQTVRLTKTFTKMLPLLNKEGKAQAFKEFAGIMGTTWLLAGTVGLPMFSVVMGFVGMALKGMKDDDQPEELKTLNFEEYFKQIWIPEHLGEMTIGGKPVSELALRGPVNFFTGLDVSSRTSLNDMWFKDQIASKTPREGAIQVAVAHAGPSVNLILSYLDGIKAYGDGDMQKFGEKVLPAVARGPLAAMKYLREGAKGVHGEDLLSKDSFTAGALLFQAIGFREANLANLQDVNFKMYTEGQKISIERNNILRNIGDAYMKGQDDRFAEWLGKVGEFDKKYPITGVVITGESIQKSLKKINEARGKNWRGLALTPQNIMLFMEAAAPSREAAEWLEKQAKAK
jgi:hypothetical protein